MLLTAGSLKFLLKWQVLETMQDLHLPSGIQVSYLASSILSHLLLIPVNEHDVVGVLD